MRSRPEHPERIQHTQLRRGLNALAAVIFLTLGLLIPLVSAINQQRWTGIETMSSSSAQGHSQSHLATIVPTTMSTATHAIISVRQEPTVVRPASTAAAAIATLIPIAPTQAPTEEPTQAPPSATPAPVRVANGVPVGQSKAGPIAMYHYIRRVDPDSDELGYQLSIRPELFEVHMAWLAKNGYTGVSLQTLLHCTGRVGRAQPGESCPALPMALTFDDGYMDAYTAALPILQRYGFSGTFYIVGDFIGQPGYMGWNELKVLRDAGMEIGSHSISHPDLTQLDLETLNHQLLQSKALLEEHLQIRVTSFCYPAGKYNAEVEEQVRLAGYENATTTLWALDGSDIFALPRRRVLGGTNAQGFEWIATSK